ncbi:MAG: putative toxin-antitoxin system toxin component, PIN family [Thermoproteota archaeon]|nr:MAG: putative toxin-antitoxin system toxin component, PIN family [Candidatus Korarchaeota archaeon]
MLKVVLDTNVIVSATLIKNSLPDKILRAWQKGKFQLIVSPEIIEEIRRVLFSEKIKNRGWMTEKEIEEFLFLLERAALLSPGQFTLKVIKEDPGDDKFIIAAIEQKADYIVSGDKHLLNLKSYQEIKIVSPREFWEILQKK